MDKPSLLEILFENDGQKEAAKTVREKGFFSRQFSGSVTKQLKRILSSRPLRLVSAISHLFSRASTKVYGTALMTFGLAGIMMYFLRLTVDMSVATPVIGAIFALISIPFLFADKPLPVFLSDFDLTDYLFYEIFCMKRHTTEALAKFPIPLAVFIGLGLAALSALVPLWQIALIIGVIVFVYVGIESPEFLFLASLFALPYVRFIPRGELWLIGAALIALLSFLVKVLYGKRVIYIEQYDIFIGIMLLFLLISGIFLKGEESFSGSISMIALSVGYLLAGNIITNSRLAERSVNAVVISAVFSSLVSVVQLVVTALTKWPDFEGTDFEFILARQDGMAVFLIAGLVLAVGMVKQSSGIARKSYILSAVLLSLSMILSGEVFAVCALLLCIPTYYVLKNNFRPGIILPLLLLLPLALLLLPNAVLDVIFYLSPSISMAEDLFALWNSSLSVLSNNLFFGIGIGSESFAEEMAALGMFGYPDSSNLFIELGLEAGIFALLSFFCILITRIKHRTVQYLYLRNSQIERLSCISGTCIFGLLAFGMVNYIWSEPSAYYFFWCLFGIGSATIRAAKRDYDDKVVYYEESSAFDSSVIDIEIG